LIDAKLSKRELTRIYEISVELAEVIESLVSQHSVLPKESASDSNQICPEE